MSKGTIKTFHQNKGFGFIACDDGSEVFFHHSAVQGGSAAIREGLKVEFDMGEGPKGKRAENVKIVK
jgi:CspA family cold shock protein